MAGWKNRFLDPLRRIDTCPTRVIVGWSDGRWKKRIGRAFIRNRFLRSTTAPASRFILLFAQIDFPNRIEYDRTGRPTILDGISVSIDPEYRSATNVLVDGPPGSSRTLERASNSLIDSHLRCLSGMSAARACRWCTLDSTNSFIDFFDSASKMTTVVVDLSIGLGVNRSRKRTGDSPNPFEMNIGRRWPTIKPSRRRMIDRSAAPIDPPGRRPSRTITTYVVGDRGERDGPLFLSARPRRRWARVLDGAPGSVVGRWRTMYDRWPI